MAVYESPFIFGIHDPGGEDLMAQAGHRGWIVFTEAIGSDPNDRRAGGPYNGDYRRWSEADFGVIVRLNNAYKPEGTLPYRTRYPDFARRCAHFVAASQGCHIWIIGNEMNFWVERPGAYAATRGLVQPQEADALRRDGEYRASPDRFSALRTDRVRTRSGLHGEPIYPWDYARCYTLCRDAIHSVPGHEEDLVLVGAVAPWNTDTRYEGNPEGDWIRYFQDILTRLGPDGCDGIVLHTYTHGPDPALIRSEARLDNPAFRHRRFHFRTYVDFMEAIPGNMRHLPVYITETDQDDPWLDANNGWVKEAYAEIERWNANPNRQQIRALVLYRWPPIDRWVIQGKEGVIQDFREALQRPLRWNPNAVPIVTDGQGLPTTPLEPADWEPGDVVYTVTVVNLRRTPGVVGKPPEDRIAQLPVGTPLTILEGPQVVDNLVWWRVQGEDGDDSVWEGWVAQAVAPDRPLLEKREPPLGDFQVGMEVRVLDVLRLRRTPGYRNKPPEDVVTDLPVDTVGKVVGGPRWVDGLVWWRLQVERPDGEILSGWAAQMAPNGVPLLAPWERPPRPEGKFRPGQTLRTTAVVNLRRTPGYVNKPDDDVLVELPYGAAVEVVEGPEEADGLLWWRVVYVDPEGQRLEGWVAERVGDRDLLELKPPPPPQPVQPPPHQTYREGDLVANISPYEVNLRRTPGYRNKPPEDVVAVVQPKELLRIVEGPREVDELFWWRVQGLGAIREAEGWVAETSPQGVRLLVPALFRDLLQLETPFVGYHRVTQLFGENPDFYRRFTYDGVPLRGHNGLDVAMPTGTPIRATDTGTVVRADFSPGGFGNFVLLEHRWGQSLYAHMDRSFVRRGQQLQRGDVLGESGNTGASTGPHLHFGVRIIPYYRGDGWGGFCDPMPFLDPTQLDMSLYGRGVEITAKLPPSPLPEEVPGLRLP